jgi:hypothetical protein
MGARVKSRSFGRSRIGGIVYWVGLQAIGHIIRRMCYGYGIDDRLGGFLDVTSKIITTKQDEAFGRKRMMTWLAPYTANNSLSALPEFTFRRVLLKGKILYPPILLGPRVEEGVPGWDLIQPLSRSPPQSSLSPAHIFNSELENPSTILLNRGFIPNPQAASIRAGHEPPPNVGEEIVVEGYLSKLIGQGWSPENMPEKGEWFWKDVQRMADWCGGEERGVQPVLVDVIDRKLSRGR